MGKILTLEPLGGAWPRGPPPWIRHWPRHPFYLSPFLSLTSYRFPRSRSLITLNRLFFLLLIAWKFKKYLITIRPCLMEQSSFSPTSSPSCRSSFHFFLAYTLSLASLISPHLSFPENLNLTSTVFPFLINMYLTGLLSDGYLVSLLSLFTSLRLHLIYPYSFQLVLFQ